MTPGTATGLFVGPVAVNDPFGGVPGEGTCGLFEYAGGVCGLVPEPGVGTFGFFEYAGGVLETPVGV